MEHPGEDDVVEVATGSLDEAVILLATDRMADAADLGGGAGFVDVVISSILSRPSSLRPLLGPAPPAAWMAVTMLR